MNTLEQTFDLRGKRVLITGASSGFGVHFADLLSRNGAEVILAARRIEKVEELAGRLRAGGGKAVAVKMDVTERASVSTALDQLTDAPDVVINNAGIGGANWALEDTDDNWDAVLDTNLKGAWTVAQEAAKRMVAAKKGGSIVNISSVLASRLAGRVSAYCASKAGLSQLTRALAMEWARYGIRVNSLAPGYFSTEINAEFLKSEAGQAMMRRVPMRRYGEYQDLDGPLLLLASDASRYMTGSEIVVDGGHLNSPL